MLVGGLWHGAGWNYVLWGGLHGAYLMINHMFRSWTKGTIPIPRFLCWIMTFSVVSFAWIFFRSPSMTRAAEVIRGLMHADVIDFTLSAVTLAGDDLYKFIAALCASIILAVFAPNAYKFFSKVSAGRYYIAAVSGACFAASLWLMTYTEKVREFLYFQF